MGLILLLFLLLLLTRIMKVILLILVLCGALANAIPSRKIEGGVKCSWRPWGSSSDCGRERRSLGWLKNFGQNMKEKIDEKIATFVGKVKKFGETVKKAAEQGFLNEWGCIRKCRLHREKRIETTGNCNCSS